jgi:solute carrier family 13 (sodium-dependent dicarboxylate transporter), member 2/3/5
MVWAIPVVLVFLPVIGIYLTRNLGRHPAPAVPEVGAWRPAEVRVLMVFAATALLWVTRQEPFGGWAGAARHQNSEDYMVAFLAVTTLFLIPDGKGDRLLDWDTATKIPWGMLILFGAGIAIARPSPHRA